MSRSITGHRLFAAAGWVLLSVLYLIYLFSRSGMGVEKQIISELYPILTYSASAEEGETVGQTQDGISASLEGFLDNMLSFHLPFLSYMEDNQDAEQTLLSDPSYTSFLEASETAADSSKENNEDSDSSNGVLSAVGEGVDAVINGTGQSQSDGSVQTAQNADLAIPAAATQISGVLYSLAQLSDFDFLVNNFYYVHSSTTITRDQLNAQTLLAKDMTIQGSNDSPQILIYHTHYSEMYADSDPNDLNTGVIGVGNYLTEILTEIYGYNVIHDTTPYPYSDSYSLAEDRVTEILAQYPSIEVVIDLHRDSANEGNILVTEVNGKETAQVMFFNGLCQTKDGPLGYISNPYLEDCLAFSLQMKLQAEAYYPGLTRANYLKAYQYNQHLSPKSMLVEVGANTNTFEQAKNAMEPLADLLHKVLSGQSLYD